MIEYMYCIMYTLMFVTQNNLASYLYAKLSNQTGIGDYLW